MAEEKGSKSVIPPIQKEESKPIIFIGEKIFFVISLSRYTSGAVECIFISSDFLKF
jgi:hypothetical protein